MSKSRILITLGVVILLVISSITFLVMANEERIKLFALERVSDKLRVELSVEEIEISVWSEFPKVRVNLNNVALGGATSLTVNPVDTILTAAKLGVALSLWDVLFSEPIVEAFILEEAQINLKQSGNGDWNTSILKIQDTNEPELDADVKVNLFRFKDVSITAHSNDNETYSVEISQAIIRGDNYDISFANGEVIGAVITEDLLPLSGGFTGEFQLGEESAVSLSIRNADINGISLNGKLDYSKDLFTEIQIEKLSVKKLESIVKEEVLEGYLSGIMYDGNASLSIKVDGGNILVNWMLPESGLALSPKITGFSMVKKGRLSAEGSYQYFSSTHISSISINSFQIDSKGFQINGEANCINTRSANWRVTTQSTVDAGAPYSSWIPALHSTEYSYLPKEGLLYIGSELSITPWGIVDEFLCTVESEKLSGALNAVPYSIGNLRTHFNNNKFQIKTLGYKWGGNVGEVKAELFGVENWFDGGAIEGDINLDAEHIDIGSILSWWENRTVAEDSTASTAFLPSGSNLSLIIESGNLTWDALECESFVTRANLTASKLKIINSTTKTLEGLVRVEGSFRPSVEGWVLNLSGSADGISLPKLFNCYDNFGQNTLRAQHMGGSLSIAGTSKMGWGKDGVWSSESLNANLNVGVSHGSLENFEVFDDVADYLKEHRLIAPLVDPNDLRERLKNIQLDNLESPIYISSSSTTIPNINIHSSAMDVSIEGVHSFSGKIDYTLGFSLRDLRKSREVEFGNIEDDGLGNMFFLAMDGTLNEPVYSYDRSAHRSHRKKAFRDEAEKIKEAIKNAGDSEETQKKKKEEKSNNLNDIDDDDF
jgi:hypothetical protein